MSNNRRSRIIQLLGKGKKQRQIAREVGCSPAFVNGIARELREAETALAQNTLSLRALPPVDAQWDIDLIRDVLAHYGRLIGADGLRLLQRLLADQSNVPPGQRLEPIIQLRALDSAVSVAKFLDALIDRERQRQLPAAEIISVTPIAAEAEGMMEAELRNLPDERLLKIAEGTDDDRDDRDGDDADGRSNSGGTAPA